MSARLLFDLTQIDAVDQALDVSETRQAYQHGAFHLPEWFIHHLDPHGDEFREQQVRLWRAITGRDAYHPGTDVETPDIAGFDPIRRPAFFQGGEASIAGDHLMALGHLLKRSGLARGARVLEYGAGMGQIALAFARLGHVVETVDVSPHRCRVIGRIADHYDLDLTPHIAEIGFNPAGRDEVYDLIYFYASFHHCLDFPAVLPKLHAILKPGGRVLLAGEPILVGQNDYMPYPWGIRLDGENVVVMRKRGWIGLGFEESFLVGEFAKAGFASAKYVEPFSSCATVYEFVRNDDAHHPQDIRR